jgi:hypothetical protein
MNDPARSRGSLWQAAGSLGGRAAQVHSITTSERRDHASLIALIKRWQGSVKLVSTFVDAFSAPRDL